MTPNISEDDINSEAVCASVSRSTYKMLTIESQKLGITRAEYIELAIRTSCPANSEWQNAWKKISLINETRKSMARLKRSISWQSKMTPEASQSLKNEILDDLAKSGIQLQDIHQQLAGMGLALSA